MENDTQQQKICNTCFQTKDITKFNKVRNTTRNKCIQCQKNNWSLRLSYRINSSEKNKEETEKIKPKDLKYIYSKQKGRCYWLNIPLTLDSSSKLTQPSIDRLDNTKGYTLDNIVISSLFANFGRNSSTVEEFKNFITTYKLRNDYETIDEIKKSTFTQNQNIFSNKNFYLEDNIFSNLKVNDTINIYLSDETKYKKDEVSKTFKNKTDYIVLRKYKNDTDDIEILEIVDSKLKFSYESFDILYLSPIICIESKIKNIGYKYRNIYRRWKYRIVNIS